MLSCVEGMADVGEDSEVHTQSVLLHVCEAIIQSSQWQVVVQADRSHVLLHVCEAIMQSSQWQVVVQADRSHVLLHSGAHRVHKTPRTLQ